MCSRDVAGVVFESGTALGVDNRHRVDLVNKCRVIDKRSLFFDGVEGGSARPLSLAALSPPVPQAEVCARQSTDAHDHHQNAEADRQRHSVIVAMYYQQYACMYHHHQFICHTQQIHVNTILLALAGQQRNKCSSCWCLVQYHCDT